MNRELILVLSLMTLAASASAADNQAGAASQRTAPSGPVHNAANDAYKRSLGTDHPLPKPTKPAKPQRPARPGKAG